MLRDANENLRSARNLKGDERAQVVADLDLEVRRLTDALARQTGEPPRGSEPQRARGPQKTTVHASAERAPRTKPTGRTQLQVSWEPGRVVAWAGGPNAATGNAKLVRELLAAAGAPNSGWNAHPPIPLSGGVNADALAIPVG